MTHPVPGAARPAAWWLRVVFAVIGVFASVLGYIGLERLSEVRPDAIADRYDILYYDLQLFFLSAELFEEPGPYPWQLQVARFVAPLFTLLAVAEAGRLLLAAEIRRLRARRASGHAVVCGDSQFAHMLADRLYADGERVVVVRSEPFGPLEYRRRRYLGVVGDATSVEVLRGAGLSRAHTVYACTDDADRNHAIANTANRLIQDRRHPPRVYVQVHDPEMCLSLQARRLGAAGSSRLRLDYFHVDDIAARALHRHHPLPSALSRPTKVLIAGEGSFRRALLVESARHWRAHRTEGGRSARPLQVDLVAPDARRELTLAVSRYPFLADVCRLSAYDRDIDGLLGLDQFVAEGYDRIYICAPDEISGLQFALDTSALWRGAQGAVFVPVYRQAALAAAFHGDARHDLLDEVHGKLRLYPVLTHACDARLIAEDLTERLAQQIHARYLHAQHRAGVRLGDAPAMVPWSRLPESLRRANRSHVQDIAAKLLNLGCVVAPRHGSAGDASAAGRAIDDRVEQLARLEHERWCRERRGDGWTYGQLRDEARRRHPALRPWDELPPAVQEQNREEIRALPDVLSDSGFELIRLSPAVPAQWGGPADGA
ncbi:RyR domain-containing protein [Micromonospora sp. WMMD1082]|uniref:RyR domain-containing protein n=1 Tax=Micromonospora sp. WMMD1082 TaxID=3016104 RepID=UPI002417D965|nr:RyR domain-containing protein [Micromonospora sp. WMMD1082]MDG4797563.1 RyR domain-containing protein [Micromonospora sp. WMMD1082]